MGKKKDKKDKKEKKLRRQQEQLGQWAGMLPPGAAARGQGLLGAIPGLSRLKPSEQFLVGALLGAGAAWVLSDEELRGKLLRAGMKLYGNLVGGFEEMKEQMADIRAEMEAGQYGGEE